MRFLKNILYIEHHELVDAGVSKGTLDAAKNRNSSYWCFVSDPSDNRKVLIHYESLRQKYKDLIQDKYGDPYRYIAYQVIKPLLKSDPKDIQMLDEYRSDGTRLSDLHNNIYREACRYLAMLSSLSPSDIRALGFKTVQNHFYPAVIQLIKADNIKLPTQYRTLKRKIKQYQSEGALAVIDSRHGNDNAIKVNEVGKALIVELLSKHNGFTPEQIAQLYNNIAEQKGWPQITSSTIVHYKYKEKIGVTSLRHGHKQWRDKFDPIVSRKRPSKPNDLWVGDGTPFELYYQKAVYDKEGRKKTLFWFRKTAYVVIDAFNDTVVGFATGENENADLARRAWKNAVLNTGCLPRQIKVDNYAIKELTPFYEGLCLNFTPSAVGNARDKVIEAFFARLYDQVVRAFPNASGRNITAKEQPNRDYLMKIRHEFPDEQNVIKQIVGSLEFWNLKKRKKLNGKSLFEQWNQADHSEDRHLTTESRLLSFGIAHKFTNTLTNKGLEVTLQGTTRLYSLPSVDFYKTIGTEYQVYYDPEDLTHIMIKADEGRIRFILDEDVKIPMSLHDQTEGDRKRLNEKLQVKKALAQEIIIDGQKKRLKDLQEADLLDALDPVAIASGLFSLNGEQKTLRNHAQNRLKTKGLNGDEVEDYNDGYDGAALQPVEVKPGEDKSYKDRYDDPIGCPLKQADD